MWSTRKGKSGSRLGHDKRGIPTFDTAALHSNLGSPRRNSLLQPRCLNFVCFRAFLSIVLRFVIIPRAYLLFCLGSPVIFGYVTFHIFVSIFPCIISIVLYSFFCRSFLVAVVILFQSSQSPHKACKFRYFSLIFCLFYLFFFLPSCSVY